MTDLTRTVYAAPKGELCPACGGHAYSGGSLCISQAADGTVTVDSRRGRPCHVCKGRGRVKEIIVVPFGDDE